MTIHVLLADDHALVRAGIRSLLEGMADIAVVAEAASAAEALAQAQALRPEIVLMDLSMPGGGLEATSSILAALPQTRIIILSMHATRDYVEQAIRAGAAGYILKDAATAELQLALAAVAQGGTWISPAVSPLLIARYLDPEAAAPPALTPRQTEILKLIAAGLATKEIAYQLGLSAKTVESHRAQLMERLQIRDVAGLVRYAIRSGLIDQE